MPDDSSMTDNELSQYIGEIARQWTLHEHVMAGLYQTVLAVSYNEAMTLCFALNPPQRRDLLSALAEPQIRDPVLLADFRTYLREYDRAKKLRNDAVHGLWTCTLGKPLLTLVKSRATASMTFATPDRQWFEDIIGMLKGLTTQAGAIHDRVFREIASRGAHQQPPQIR